MNNLPAVLIAWISQVFIDISDVWEWYKGEGFGAGSVCMHCLERS